MLPETRARSQATFDDVLALYRRGVAETELPADELTARSLMPPGSAADRDFSSLAPTLPAFLADACTGCMACVNVCPDSALYATAMPESQLAKAMETYFSGAGADAEAAERPCPLHRHVEVRPSGGEDADSSRRSSGCSWTRPSARAARNVSPSAPQGPCA